MRRFALAVLFLVVTLGPARADCVLLLHGLARGPNSLIVLEKALSQQGYHVVNQAYPSTSAPIRDLAKHVGQGLDQCPADQPVHIVTHSMGGILARIWLADHAPANLGRVVMLASPNQGSPLVDRLRALPFYDALNGPAGLEMGTTADSVPLALGPVTFPLGVIAGDATANPLSSALIPGPDDGKVGVAASHVAGEADHLRLPVTHTFMMNNPSVIAQVIAFLRSGTFAR
ncbi:alpha/beta fold hydrolase [Paracoccus tegillarcae]|uniref:AB hydrolase-1 domain-containing protein n=1 Tax=Paracoccus tegillarcae TaxID=1529068 RepID=A0A2K9F6T0_9RHOB|nr:alpha/beta fold hydrolase [Paracoccus tegillarcae]AUH34891.1 hypothetical protein CUV01_17255 [Paracoccus tegillarcae]